MRTRAALHRGRDLLHFESKVLSILLVCAFTINPLCEALPGRLTDIAPQIAAGVMTQEAFACRPVWQRLVPPSAKTLWNIRRAATVLRPAHLTALRNRAGRFLGECRSLMLAMTSKRRLREPASDQFIKEHHRIISIIFALLCADSLMTVFIPWIDRGPIDRVVDAVIRHGLTWSHFPLATQQYLIQLVGLSIVLATGVLFVRAAGNYLLTATGIDLISYFKQYVNQTVFFRNIFAPIRVRENLSSLSFRVVDDPNDISMVKLDTEVRKWHSIVHAVATFAVTWSVFPLAAAFVILTSIVRGFLWVPYYVMESRFSAERQALRGKMFAQSQKTFERSRVFEMRARGDETTISEFNNPLVEAERRLNKRILRFETLYGIMTSLFEDVAVGRTLAFGGFALMAFAPHHAPSVGDIVEANALAGGLQFSIKGLFDQFDKTSRAIGKLGWLMERLRIASPGAPAFESRQLAGDITLKNIHYGSVRNVSLYIRRGSHVDINGENGLGKSTVLEILSGAAEPSEGQVLMHGTDGREYAPYHMGNDLKKLVRVVTSQPDPFISKPTLREKRWEPTDQYFTFREIVSEDGAHSDFETTLKDRRADWLLETFPNLDAAVAEPVTLSRSRTTEASPTLSDGQRKRLALAQAVAEPDLRLLVLDEPLAGLDESPLETGAPAKLAKTVQRLREEGITVITVSHAHFGSPDEIIKVTGEGFFYDSQTAQKKYFDLTGQLVSVLLSIKPREGLVLRQALQDALASRNVNAFYEVEDVLDRLAAVAADVLDDRRPSLNILRASA